MGLDPNANAPPVVVRLADQAIEWLEKTIPQPALTLKRTKHAMSVFKSTYAQPKAAIISAFHKTFLASCPPQDHRDVHRYEVQIGCLPNDTQKGHVGDTSSFHLRLREDQFRRDVGD